MIEGLLDVNQAARLLSVPISWIYSKAECGDLPSVKIGRYRRFVREELENWLRKQREASSTGRSK